MIASAKSSAVEEHPIIALVMGIGAALGIAGGMVAALGIAGGMVAALLGFLVAASLVDAWVFVRVWQWFAMPLGAPELTYWTSFGLLLLVRFARPHEMTAEREGDGKVKTPIGNFVIRTLLYPAIIYGIGAFAHAMLVR